MLLFCSHSYMQDSWARRTIVEMAKRTKYGTRVIISQPITAWQRQSGSLSVNIRVIRPTAARLPFVRAASDHVESLWSIEEFGRLVRRQSPWPGVCGCLPGLYAAERIPGSAGPRANRDDRQPAIGWGRGWVSPRHRCPRNGRIISGLASARSEDAASMPHWWLPSTFERPRLAARLRYSGFAVARIAAVALSCLPHLRLIT